MVPYIFSAKPFVAYSTWLTTSSWSTTGHPITDSWDSTPPGKHGNDSYGRVSFS
jgi:hypothetical protein